MSGGGGVGEAGCDLMKGNDRASVCTPRYSPPLCFREKCSSQKAPSFSPFFWSHSDVNGLIKASPGDGVVQQVSVTERPFKCLAWRSIFSRPNPRPRGWKRTTKQPYLAHTRRGPWASHGNGHSFQIKGWSNIYYIYYYFTRGRNTFFCSIVQ